MCKTAGLCKWFWQDFYSVLRWISYIVQLFWFLFDHKWPERLLSIIKYLHRFYCCVVLRKTCLMKPNYDSYKLNHVLFVGFICLNLLNNETFNQRWNFLCSSTRFIFYILAFMLYYIFLRIFFCFLFPYFHCWFSKKTSIKETDISIHIAKKKISELFMLWSNVFTCYELIGTLVIHETISFIHTRNINNMPLEVIMLWWWWYFN